jgi:putative ABC transport system substrate-binding protein
MPIPDDVDSEALISRLAGPLWYGVNFLEVYRRAAVFVDKILMGAKPADIPVEQATKFAVVTNLQTAKALDLEFLAEGGPTASIC